MKREHRSTLLSAAVMVAVLVTAPAIALPSESDGEGGIAPALPQGLQGESVTLSSPWITVPPCPHGVSRPTGEVVDGHLFVIGGEPRDGFVQEYDPVTATWDDTNALMPTPASNLCAAVINSSIYIPGGYTGTVSLDTLQVYTPALDIWETVATDPLPAALHGLACAAWGGKLYVFGGTAGAVYYDTTYIYDPAAPDGTRWSTGASAPVIGAYGDAVAVDGYLYYAGMRDSTSTDLAGVYRYDPGADTWAVMPSLSTPRGAAGMWAYEGKIAVGGGGWSTYLSSVEEYDLSAGTGGMWTPGNSLVVGRRTFAAAQDYRGTVLYAAAGWAGAYLADVEQSAFVLPMAFFNSRALFNASVPGLPIEDFEEGNVLPGGVGVCTDPYDSTTDDDCWDPGDILPGIRLGSSAGGGMVILGEGVVGQPTIVTGANSFNQFTRLEFPSGVFAVGFDLLSNGVPGELVEIRVFGQGGQTGAGYAPADVPGLFWGVLSEGLITRIEIEPFSLSGELVDNVAFGGGGILFADGFEWGNMGGWTTVHP
jgi:hypothetical protein